MSADKGPNCSERRSWFDFIRLAVTIRFGWARLFNYILAAFLYVGFHEVSLGFLDRGRCLVGAHLLLGRRLECGQASILSILDTIDCACCKGKGKRAFTLIEDKLWGTTALQNQSHPERSDGQQYTAHR